MTETELHPMAITDENSFQEAKGNGAGKNTQEEQKENSLNSINSNWEDPVIPSGMDTPDIPADLLPGWLGEYVDAVARNTQTPPGMAVMMSLSVIATCIQKRFEVSPYGDDYREPLALWTATALPPGSRKTAVVSALTNPLSDWEVEEQERLKDETDDRATKIAVNKKTIDRLETAAANTNDASERKILIEQINQLKSETPEELLAPRLWTGDVTPERLQSLMAEHGERMGLLSDEGGIFEIMGGLYSHGKANLDVFNKAHAGSPVRVDRGGRTVHLQRPALSFGLAIQPAVLQDFGSGGKRLFRGIGTLARFLYCIPNSNIGQRNIKQRSPVPEALKRNYSDQIFKLLGIKPLLSKSGAEIPRIIRLSPQALSAWETFSQYIESKQGEGGEYEHIQDWTAKLPGAALRIAGLCNVAEHGESSLEIDLKTLERSLDLCEVLIPHTLTAIDMMGADQGIADAKVVIRWIIKNGELSFKQSECHKANHGRFSRVDRLLKALDVVREWNVISVVDPVKTDHSKKLILLYHVNPKIFKETKNGLA